MLSGILGTGNTLVNKWNSSELAFSLMDNTESKFVVTVKLVAIEM